MPRRTAAAYPTGRATCRRQNRHSGDVGSPRVSDGTAARPAWWWWVGPLLGFLPHGFLGLLLLQAPGPDAVDGEIQRELGMLSAFILLFWALLVCGFLAIWRRTRPLAGAVFWGTFAGFLLTLVIAQVA